MARPSADDAAGAPTPPHGDRSASAPVVLPFALVALAVAAVSVNLRPSATAIGPVLAEIQEGLGISPSVAGLLTALPGFVFGLAGLTAVGIARRFGLVGTVCGGLLVVAAAATARAVVDSAAAFLILSAITLAGMGIGNVLVPAVIKRYAGRRTAGVSSIYTVGLGLGAALPIFAAPPLVALGADGWRWSLGLWGLFALLAAIVWAVMRLRVRGRDHGVGRRAAGLPIQRSRTAVALCAFFGLQSTNAYVTFGWLAQMYRDAGISASAAAALVGVVTLFGIPGGLLMPRVATRSSSVSAWAAGLSLAVLAGWTGLLIAPASLSILWALLLGLGQFTFPLALTLIVVRAGTPETTARLSGFAQPVGYLFAALGPLLVGVLRDATGGWTAPLLMLMAGAAGLIVSGVMVGRGRTVDEELAAHGA
ncbi:MFS transporter [Kocuria palustris]|uniref:MFS transporter n=1 Tax=Kocuria palustris TaxID=71999 RepID=UPI0011A50F8E|nr:MFS transporter [Kocuria palustris]